jgi:hypothetical protein
LQFIDEMWTDRLAKLKQAAERAERNQSDKARPKRSKR